MHDRRPFAVILAHDNQRAAGDAGGAEVGQRVRRDIDADRPLEGDSTPDGIVDRGGQHGGGGGFACVCLEPDTQFAQHILRVCQHIHQVADRRALIAANIAHTVFQQRLSQGQNAFARKHITVAFAQVLYLFFEGTFGHLDPLRSRACGCF